jgi:hypothetical protein
MTWCRIKAVTSRLQSPLNGVNTFSPLFPSHQLIPNLNPTCQPSLLLFTTHSQIEPLQLLIPKHRPPAAEHHHLPDHRLSHLPRAAVITLTIPALSCPFLKASSHGPHSRSARSRPQPRLPDRIQFLLAHPSRLGPFPLLLRAGGTIHLHLDRLGFQHRPEKRILPSAAAAPAAAPSVLTERGEAVPASSGLRADDGRGRGRRPHARGAGVFRRESVAVRQEIARVAHGAEDVERQRGGGVGVEKGVEGRVLQEVKAREVDEGDECRAEGAEHPWLGLVVGLVLLGRGGCGSVGWCVGSRVGRRAGRSCLIGLGLNRDIGPGEPGGFEELGHPRGFVAEFQLDGPKFGGEFGLQAAQGNVAQSDGAEVVGDGVELDAGDEVGGG